MMLDKFKKIIKIIKKRKIFSQNINKELYIDKLNNILEKHKLEKLPQIEINDLFSYYNYNPQQNSKIFNVDFTEGISPVIDYYCITNIAKALDIKSYFEIGTWTGISAYNISKALNTQTRIVTLDIPLDHNEVELFGIPIDNFGYYSKNIPNIEHIKCDSMEFNFTDYKKSIDLVFIDGNHSYDYVSNDTKIALELIKDKNSVILWHDYILCGELNKNVFCGILDAIPQEKHKHLYHLYQSNLAIYSESFNFEKKVFDKWHIPKIKFDIEFNLHY